VKAVEKIRVDLGHYTNLHQKKNKKKQKTFFNKKRENKGKYTKIKQKKKKNKQDTFFCQEDSKWGTSNMCKD